MEKKELKMYETPAVEIVEMESAGAMLAGSDLDSDKNPDYEIPWD